MISEQSRSGVQILSIDISAKMKTITKVPISWKLYVSVSFKDSKTCPRKEHFYGFCWSAEVDLQHLGNARNNRLHSNIKLFTSRSLCRVYVALLPGSKGY